MRTKKQKKILTLTVLTGICAVCMIIGFAVITSPVKITFDATGGDATYNGEHIKPMNAKPNGDLNLPAPIRPGYRFDGWYTSASSTKAVTKANKSKMSLVAKWTPLQYTASLYINGEFLRDVKIPQNQSGGLGPDFMPTPRPGDVFTDFKLLDYWYYFDENGIETRLQWHGTIQWGIVQVINGTPTLQSMIHHTPFRPTTNVALNAGIGYNYISIAFVADGQEVATAIPSAQIGSSITLRSQSEVTIASDRTLIGWRLEDESDIYTVGETTGKSFFLDPKLYATCAPAVPPNPPKLTFTAVTVAKNSTGANGTYNKVVKDGRIAIERTSVTPVDRVEITDKTQPGTLLAGQTVSFDFAGGRNSLRRTKDNENKDFTQEEMKTRGRYPLVPTIAAATRTSVVRQVNQQAKVPLLLATGYAVGGKTFEGWRCNLDDRVYPAGMDFVIPRGVVQASDLSFSAVWKDVRELVAFDLDGGKAGWRESAFYKKPDQTIKLPAPTRYGYEFKQWEDIDGKRYAAGDTFTVADQKQRLTAKWEPKKIGKISVISFYTGNPFASHEGTHSGGILNAPFGDTIVMTRDNLSHLGWRFKDNVKSKGNKIEYIEFHFGAPFVSTVRIKIDESFCTKHLGSSNDKNLFTVANNGNIFGTPIV